MKDYILFFFKIMLIIWWIIFGIIIIVVTFHAQNWYVALIGLFVETVWISISGTAIYWNNKDYIEKHEND